jgi:hypothetical protein
MSLREMLERAGGIEPPTSSLGIPQIAGIRRNQRDENSLKSWVFFKPAFLPFPCFLLNFLHRKAESRQKN